MRTTQGQWLSFKLATVSLERGGLHKWYPGLMETISKSRVDRMIMEPATFKTATLDEKTPAPKAPEVERLEATRSLSRSLF